MTSTPIYEGELKKKSEWRKKWNVRKIFVHPASPDCPTAKLEWRGGSKPKSIELDHETEVKIEYNPDAVGGIFLGASDDAPSQLLVVRRGKKLMQFCVAPGGSTLPDWLTAIETAQSPSSAAATATVLPVQVWEWEDDHEGSGHWKPFDPASAAKLAAARSAGANNLVLNVKGFAYDIDLTAMRQKKRISGFPRRIRADAAGGAASGGMHPGSLYPTQPQPPQPAPTSAQPAPPSPPLSGGLYPSVGGASTQHPAHGSLPPNAATSQQEADQLQQALAASLREAEEQARREAPSEKARREAAEKARREAAAEQQHQQALQQALAASQREAEARARQEAAEARARREADEQKAKQEALSGARDSWQQHLGGRQALARDQLIATLAPQAISLEHLQLTTRANSFVGSPGTELEFAL